MDNYDVLEAATDLVGNQLDVMEALYEAKRFRIDARSRLVCRCSSCRSESETALAWVESLRA